MKILLTGFEPFGGSAVNPSQMVVQTLLAEPPAGITLRGVILPVDRIQGPYTLLKAVQDTDPQVVVCLGEASGRASISIERLAVNLLDFRIPDNRGVRVEDEPVCPDGPAAYFATIPVRGVLRAVLAAGVPAELSLSAGSYLCNQVLYELLHYLRTHKLSIPAGFIHLPALPEQAADRQKDEPARGVTASMSLVTMLKGIRAALDLLAQETRSK